MCERDFVRMRSAEFMLGRRSRIRRQDEWQDAVAKDQQRMAGEAEHKSAMMAKDPSSKLCGNTWSSPETSVEKISSEPRIVDPGMKILSAVGVEAEANFELRAGRREIATRCFVGRLQDRQGSIQHRQGSMLPTSGHLG